MRRASRKSLLAFFLAVLATPQLAYAQGVSREHMNLAAQVARHMGVGNLLEMVAAQQSMQGLQREVFLALGRQRAETKDLIENRMPSLIAPLLAESFTRPELETVLAFLVSDTGKKWVTTNAAITVRIGQSLQRSPEIGAAFFVMGCTSAIVTNTIVKNEQARSPGQKPPSLPELLEASKPLQDRASTSCNCLAERLASRFGAANWLLAMQNPANHPGILEATRACEGPVTDAPK